MQDTTNHAHAIQAWYDHAYALARTDTRPWDPAVPCWACGDDGWIDLRNGRVPCPACRKRTRDATHYCTNPDCLAAFGVVVADAPATATCPAYPVLEACPECGRDLTQYPERLGKRHPARFLGSDALFRFADHLDYLRWKAVEARS
jgi:hypothetical protein